MAWTADRRPSFGSLYGIGDGYECAVADGVRLKVDDWFNSSRLRLKSPFKIVAAILNRLLFHCA